MKNVMAVKHKVQPIDWNKQGEEYNEPRFGERYSIYSTITGPQGVDIGTKNKI